ncbi:MAG: SlyX protein [Hyphomicrobiales bacterium]|jgi:SlyX protein|nr:SlyX protein [Hyphomicrobiales bacterium]
MSESATPSARIEALEVRIAHQDRIIEDLNKSVTDQWKQIDGLAKQIARMADRLQRVEDSASSPDAADPPPPHY